MKTTLSKVLVGSWTTQHCREQGEAQCSNRMSRGDLLHHELCQ